MVFGKRWPKHNWNLEEEPIKQIDSFSHLGVVFIHTGSWATHFKQIFIKQQQYQKY